MKYKTDIKSLFIILLILYILFLILTFFPSFDYVNLKVSSSFIYSSIILLISFVIYFLLNQCCNYYLLEKKTLIIKKTFSKREIILNNIKFIDDSKLKKGIIYIYLNTNERLVLTTDKKSTLNDELKNKCKKLITKEEFENTTKKL